MKLEVKPRKDKLADFSANMSRDVLRTLKTKYNFKEVKEMTVTSEFYWSIFQNTGSPVAYLLYKEEADLN